MISEEYADWQATIDAICASGGTTLILGEGDVGKTTFARLLVNALTERHGRVAYLDGDIGQSEVGPPTCVGLGFASAPVLALSDLPPHALAFVGSTSPIGLFMEHLSAIRKLADQADGCPLVVDTCGYTQGSNARKLQQHTFDLMNPAHLIALQRREELTPLFAPLTRRTSCHVNTPPIPKVIGVKPPKFRQQRRVMRFASYFADAKLHTYAMEDVGILGTWLNTGTPVAAHLHKFLAQTLEPFGKMYYAELSGRHLGIMTSQPIPPQSPALALAQEPFRAQSVSITVAPRLRHLVIGLEDATGKLLGLGTLEALDFRRRTLGIMTPVRAPAAACILRFGLLRVQPDGTELGVLKASEL
jgi:polynucleotide 5'-hydroxyl-kinase GRC3/NOL9